MHGISDYISSHPLAVMAGAFVALLLLYFLFKQLIKLALVLILISLAVGGYYYFKDPQKAPENMLQTLRDTRIKAGKALETGKQAYQQGKVMYEKGKELTKEAGDLLKKNEGKEKPKP